MRPEDTSDADKIGAGLLRSLQLAGYDYPIRKLRRSGGVTCVTLPLQVRSFLKLEYGDWLLFAECSWPGLVAFFKVTAERFKTLKADECREVEQIGRKVQKSKRTMLVTISPEIRKLLSAEVGDNLIFDIAPRRGTVIVAALKAGGDSPGCRRPG
ncbi:hypothetical protein ES703_46159 [subsurface metagenome]